MKDFKIFSWVGLVGWFCFSYLSVSTAKCSTALWVACLCGLVHLSCHISTFYQIQFERCWWVLIQDALKCLLWSALRWSPLKVLSPPLLSATGHLPFRSPSFWSGLTLSCLCASCAYIYIYIYIYIYHCSYVSKGWKDDDDWSGCN